MKKYIISKVQDIDVLSLRKLFTRYGRPYGYVSKKSPNVTASASKYAGQYAVYVLSPIGKYDMSKATAFAEFLESKGYVVSIDAPDVIVKLKKDLSSSFYKRGHERHEQYDSVTDDALSRNINDNVTIFADSIDEAITMYQKTINDASIHHDWLVEHAKKLFNYAKDDNFAAVKTEAENIINGLKSNRLADAIKVKLDNTTIEKIRNVVSRLGFKVSRIYEIGDDLVVNVDFDFSRSQAFNLVRKLKPLAKEIGYKDVYIDDDDIVFSIY